MIIVSRYEKALVPFDSLDSAATSFVAARVEEVGGRLIAAMVNACDIEAYVAELEARGSSAVEPTAEKSTNKSDQDLYNEYVAVKITKDPCGIYTNKTLGEATRDPEWRTWALKFLKNEYLKERVQFIASYEGRGER